MLKRSLIQIYTGDGKGKTTASVGLAIRAAAHKLRICYIYFHKNPNKCQYAEQGILENLGVDVFGFAKKHPHFYKNINRAQVRRDCLGGLGFIKKVFGENKYEMLILDEILISLRDGFLKEEEILDILDSKPKKLELILTGRGATQKIIEKADLVSRIEKIKHPYDRGVERRQGIEY